MHYQNVNSTPIRPLDEIKDQIPALLERYLAGESSRALATENNVHQSSLSRAFIRLGAPTHEELLEQAASSIRKQVVKLYRENLKLSEIATAVGVTQHLVKKYLADEREPTRPRGASKVKPLPADVLTTEWLKTEAAAWACG